MVISAKTEPGLENESHFATPNPGTFLTMPTLVILHSQSVKVRKGRQLRVGALAEEFP